MDSNNTNIRRRVLPSPDPRAADPLLKRTQSADESKGFERFFIRRNKIQWYWAPVFMSFWLLLYYSIAIPAFHRLPKPLNIKDEVKYPDAFIAERAEINLQKLVELGPRVVGSTSNEQGAVKYFMSYVQKLRTEAKDLYEIEADVQVASGSYCHWQMVNMYQSIQNFVIKISPKGYKGDSYLLVNSHYDTVPFGPGAGDDGAMVAIMLEVLRVVSQSNKPLKHPVVFLFNGAEENPLQASHAFITQHKWAKKCKALINLDSAGNGGREILFQSGPNHPWLMRHYRRAVVHPYASTVAEEMFQRHFIPSDTDFRIFRDHGKVPGLDMAHQYNGYVYHTRFDRPEVLPRGTLQNTGDNVLALVRELANAPELENPQNYSEGHTIFFDVMGSFLVFYSETEGIILNIVVSLAALAACAWSFRTMASNTGVKFATVLKRTMYTFLVQVVAVIAAATLCFFIAIVMDLLHLPLSWFSNSWLIFGLYFCPLFFGFAIVPAIYFHHTKDDRFPVGHRVQLLLNCHCTFLAMLTIVLTICNIRSAFLFMITLLFYTTGLIINLVTKLHNKPVSWLIPHIICGIPPFLFYAYISHGFFVTFIPMTGRFGSTVNPDLIICAFTVGVGILTGGFMIPALNLFHKSKTIICSLLVFTAICFIIAATPLGFPYRPETNVQRFNIIHARRTFRDMNNEVRRVETGYFMLPMDRRFYSVKNHVTNMTLAKPILNDCENEMFCGLPLYNHRWVKARHASVWIPGPNPTFDILPSLRVKAKNQLSKTKLRYDMELTGPDHMAIYIRPLDKGKVTNWSFHWTPLRMEWNTPYFIYFSYGVNGDPLKFWLEIEKESGVWNTPAFEIGVVGHWIHDESKQTAEFKKFLTSFPKYVDPIAWPSSYDTFYY